MRKLILLSFVLFFSRCSTTPKFYFDDNLCKSKGEYQKKRVLDAYKANDDKYSLLIFTFGFEDERILIINHSDSLLNKKIKSDPSLGLAEGVRINRNFDTKIKEIDNDYSFFLDVKSLKKGKYVYISKDKFSKKIKYEVIYSNSLCGFK